MADTEPAVSVGQDNIAETIARQAEKIFRKGRSARKRCDTFFYTIVIGGNTDVIKQTVEYMEHNGMQNVLDWLLRRKDRKGGDKPCIRRTYVAIKRLAVFLVLCFFNVLTTPVFYGIHMVTNALLTPQKVKISKNIRLPLVFALSSMREEMWMYVISLGARVTDTDDEGNNIFHYIADISKESSEQAIKMFRKLLLFMNDADIARFLLLDQSDSAGLSALEYMSKFGSSSLLCEVINCPNLMRHTVLAAGIDNVTVNQELNDDTTPTTDTKIDYVDVSRYECGSLVHQSSVLNILSTRKLTTMTVTELKLFHKASVVGKWMSMKVQQMMPGAMLLIFRDIAISVMVMWILFHAYMIVQYERVLSVGEWSVFVSEELALKENTSHIFSPEAHTNMLDKLGRSFAVEDNRVKEISELWMENRTDNNTHIDLSLNVDALYEFAQSMKDYQDVLPKLYFGLHVRDILVYFAQSLFRQKPNVFKIPENLNLIKVHALELEVIDHFQNFAIEDAPVPFNVHALLDYDKFKTFICIPWSLYHTSDMLQSHHLPSDKGGYHTGSACKRQTLINFASDQCSGNRLYVYQQLLSFDQSRTLNPDWLFIFYYILTLVHLLLDLLERCRFMYVSVVDNDEVRNMLKVALGTQLPGSYLAKQINLLSILLFSLCFNKKYWLQFGLRVGAGGFLSTYEIVTVTTMLVLRSIMHIHSLRLLPGIGHFVITMFTMGNSLLSFSIVYGIVVFIFSVIFQLIFSDPECIIEKLEGFDDLTDSIFSTIRLTFGHGDITAFYSNIQGRVTYLLYIVIVGLLLMNLIIAIMSSTATDVMREPWSDTLWQMGWLEEALSAEYTFSVLNLPFRCCCKCRYISHQNAGYIVERESGGGYKMYIPIQQGPIQI